MAMKFQFGNWKKYLLNLLNWIAGGNWGLSENCVGQQSKAQLRENTI
jgi:hypothetical protein